MPNTNRTIDELLADYAAALRDGCIPIFLKSLTRKEASQIASSEEFRYAAQMARALNGVAFADKVKISNVSLFIERVNAEIASRMRKSKAPQRAKHSAGFPRSGGPHRRSASEIENRDPTRREY